MFLSDFDNGRNYHNRLIPNEWYQAKQWYRKLLNRAVCYRLGDALV